LAELQAAAKEFFDLPLEEKRKVLSSHCSSIFIFIVHLP
jgi:isopenicillin N synthase-like dioxygenase